MRRKSAGLFTSMTATFAGLTFAESAAIRQIVLSGRVWLGRGHARILA